MPEYIKNIVVLTVIKMSVLLGPYLASVWGTTLDELECFWRRMTKPRDNMKRCHMNVEMVKKRPYEVVKKLVDSLIKKVYKVVLLLENKWINLVTSNLNQCSEAYFANLPRVVFSLKEN